MRSEGSEADRYSLVIRPGGWSGVANGWNQGFLVQFHRVQRGVRFIRG